MKVGSSATGKAVMTSGSVQVEVLRPLGHDFQGMGGGSKLIAFPESIN